MVVSAEAGKPWSVSFNNVSVGTAMLVYVFLRLLSCCEGRVESLPPRLYGPQSRKHSLAGFTAAPF